MNITIKEKDYQLNMTRKGIREAERAGMNLSTLQEKPMSGLSYLWYAAIYSAHPMAFDKACDLLDDYLDESKQSTTKLLTELSNAYSKVFG